jgi:hypothetical protein
VLQYQCSCGILKEQRREELALAQPQPKLEVIQLVRDLRACAELELCVPCRAVPCRAVPCRAVPCRAVPCRAVPCEL